MKVRFETWFVGASALLPLLLLVLTGNDPLIEHHSFRQTQTAFSAYWMTQGHWDPIHYLTPVLGTPWQVPLEFPLFQWMVAALVSVLGTPLDLTGRCLSLAFLYLTAPPLLSVLRPYDRSIRDRALLVLFSSPILAFFSRAFLIETFATFLALSFMAAYLRFARGGAAHWLLLTLVLGWLAGLQKVTTFLPVGAACGIHALVTILRERRLSARSCMVIATLMLSLVVPALWIRESDAIKEAGEMTRFMTSDALRLYNLGSWSLRAEPLYWFNVFVYRLLLLGGISLLAILALVQCLRKQPKSVQRSDAWLFAVAGLLGPLVFANVQDIHDYYQVSSIALLGCATALWSGSSRAAEENRRLLPALLLVNVFLIGIVYVPMIRHPTQQNADSYAAGVWLSERVPPDQVILVDGNNWDSTVPYYARRFAVMLATPDADTSWISRRDALIRDPSPVLGGRKLGAVVVCQTRFGPEPGEAERVLALARGEEHILPTCVARVR